jgi:hypothetical protein
MKPDRDIINELQEVAPTLGGLDRVNLYQVSEGYFEDSAMKIIGMIEKPTDQVEVPPTLASVGRKHLYSAPASIYFESFPDDLMAIAHAEEIEEELSFTLPILQHIPKRESYKVPADYFASFPASVTRLVSKKSAPSISIMEHWVDIWSGIIEAVTALLARPRYSFAMASVVGVIVCIALVTNTQTGMSGDEAIFAQMQQVSDADLHHYIVRHRDEFDEHVILHNINNAEFTHYFDKPEEVTSHIESHTQGSTDEDITEDIVD